MTAALLLVFSAQKLDYDEVFSQSSSTNCTAYIGGIQQNLTGKFYWCVQVRDGAINLLNFRENIYYYYYVGTIKGVLRE